LGLDRGPGVEAEGSAASLAMALEAQPRPSSPARPAGRVSDVSTRTACPVPSLRSTPLGERGREVAAGGRQAESGGSGEGLPWKPALNARPATRDVAAFFRPSREVREAAARVAARSGVPDRWLNDAVKGFLSPRGGYDPYLELPHLRVFVARPEYLLAMKCASMRLGAEFHDPDDVRYLHRYSNLTTVDEAQEVVTRYFERHQLFPKTRHALEELLGG
jgi:hypothetical protein